MRSRPNKYGKRVDSPFGHFRGSPSSSRNLQIFSSNHSNMDNAPKISYKLHVQPQHHSTRKTNMYIQ
ncbi:hypothetical protein WN51_03535 [Melipona quadrifasciata]|uniref:Uncharacterized protein n=1 Tax=Melipona quadrifasciata TaxID=166423 RepID=A0A0N0U3X2_9HYME|nr:hypothetical protein WN51_03535 [Melipona quadrifasciata]